MNRDDVVTYLAVEFAELASIANLPLVDNTSGISICIDEALLLYGLPTDYFDTNTIDDTQFIGFNLLLRYRVLARLLPKLATQVNISVTVPGISRSKSQIFINTKILYDLIKKEVSDAGYDVTENDMLTVYIQLDFI